MLRPSFARTPMPRSGRALHRTRAIAAQMRHSSTWDDPDAVVKTQSRGALRIYTLNRPRPLNALNDEMLDILRSKIEIWQGASTCGIICGQGEGKAFCAGGDVVDVVNKARNPETRAQASEFFRKEFELDYLLATLPKPYVAIMDGYTMGGGVGLSAPAHFRVATEKTVWAMPEAAIGYCPDVGASYYLSRLDGQIGTYLGLTGKTISGRHVYELGLATHYVSSRQIPMLVESLSQLQGVVPPLEFDEDPAEEEFIDEDRENQWEPEINKRAYRKPPPPMKDGEEFKLEDEYETEEDVEARLQHQQELKDEMMQYVKAKARNPQELKSMEALVDEQVEAELEAEKAASEPQEIGESETYFPLVKDTIMQYSADREADEPRSSLRGAVRSALDDSFSKDSVEEIVERLKVHANSKNTDVSSWATETLELLSIQSPTSLKLALETIHAGRKMSLYEAFVMELRIAHAFCNGASTDFDTGVNFKLVQKKKGVAPWSPATLQEVDRDILKRFFAESSPFLEGVPQMAFANDPETLEVLESRILPYNQFGLPAEADVERIVRGLDAYSGSTSVTREEVIMHFADMQPERYADVEEKVSEIIDRKCRITDNNDGNYVWLTWKEGNASETAETGDAIAEKEKEKEKSREETTTEVENSNSVEKKNDQN